MAGESENSRKVLLILNILLLIVFLVLAGVLMFALIANKRADPVVLQANVYIASDADIEKSHTGGEGEPAGYFLVKSVEDNRVTVSGDAQMGVNSVIAGGISEAAPQGFLRRVTGVEKSGQDTVLTTVPAALDEAIKECDVTAQYVLKPDGNYVPLQHKGVTASGWGFLATPAFADDRLENIIDKEYMKGSLKITAGVMLELELKINSKGIHFKLVGHVQGKLTYNMIEMQASETLFTRPYSGALMVGPVPVVWNNNFSIDMDADAKIEGALKPAEVSLDKKFGFRYDSDKGRRGINEDNSKAQSIGLADNETSLDGNITLELKFKDAFTLYGVAGPKLQLSLKLELTGGLEEAVRGDKENLLINLGDKKYRGFLHYKVTVPISGEFILQIPNYNPFSKDKPFEFLKQELFDTGDTITLIDWREPELSKDFMKDFDLSDIRLPYYNKYDTYDGYFQTHGNPTCPPIYYPGDDESTVFKPMATSPDDCWKAIENGESVDKWSNQYAKEIPYIKADISSVTYADYNNDGYLDVAFVGDTSTPDYDGIFINYILIANVYRPNQPFIVDLSSISQGSVYSWTFYEGGLFTSAESSGPEEPTKTNFKFVIKPDSLTIEPTQTQGTKEVAQL